MPSIVLAMHMQGKQFLVSIVQPTQLNQVMSQFSIHFAVWLFLISMRYEELLHPFHCSISIRQSLIVMLTNVGDPPGAAGRINCIGSKPRDKKRTVRCWSISDITVARIWQYQYPMSPFNKSIREKNSLDMRSKMPGIVSISSETVGE